MTSSPLARAGGGGEQHGRRKSALGGEGTNWDPGDGRALKMAVCSRKPSAAPIIPP
jgi:hypothetical protein